MSRQSRPSCPTQALLDCTRKLKAQEHRLRRKLNMCGEGVAPHLHPLVYSN